MADEMKQHDDDSQSYVKPAIVCERDVDLFAAQCNSLHSGQPGCRLSGECLFAFSA
jgi:hypothetical protein